MPTGDAPQPTYTDLARENAALHARLAVLEAPEAAGPDEVTAALLQASCVRFGVAMESPFTNVLSLWVCSHELHITAHF